MNDNPTLREAVQAFGAWLSSLGDIHVGTIMEVGAIVALIIGVLALVLSLCTWLGRFSVLTWRYRGLGHTRLHALRLTQADMTARYTKKQREKNPFYKGQPTWFAATPAEREAWAQ